MRTSVVRGIVCLILVIVLTVLALAFNTGTGTLSALGIGQLAALCPVGALESWLGAKSIGLHGVVCLVVTVVIVAIVGKAFCAWACPTPWLQRFFHPARKQKSSKGQLSEDDPADAGDTSEAVVVDAARAEAIDASIADALGKGGCVEGCALSKVGGKRDGLQLDTRHVVLGGALVSSLVAGFPVFCLVCPVGLSFATLYGLWHLLQFNETTWGMLVFPIILVLEVVFLRKWCSKICPISALLGLVSKLNFTLKPRVDQSACLRSKGVDCHACVDACPEEVDPHGKDIPECSKCGACVDACPAHAIKIK